MTGTGAGGDRNVRWAYDDRNELTQAKWYPGTDPDATTDGIPGRQFTYTFDCIGNRTTDSGDPGVTSYTSNALNQYTGTSGPSESFSYDADGNLIADGQYTYVWDAEEVQTSPILSCTASMRTKYEIRSNHYPRGFGVVSSAG